MDRDDQIVTILFAWIKFSFTGQCLKKLIYLFLGVSLQGNCVKERPEMCLFCVSFCSVCFTKGAIDLAAKSAGIIPGSPVPVLDADGLSGVSPLSPDRVTTVVTGQESTTAHQNGSSITTVEVRVSWVCPSIVWKAVVMMSLQWPFSCSLLLDMTYHGKPRLCCVACVQGLKDQITIALNGFPSHRVAFICDTVQVVHPKIWA